MHIGFFDGSASPNPGNVGLGACICFEQNVICKSAKYGGTGTNNVAEYKALIHLLELVLIGTNMEPVHLHLMEPLYWQLMEPLHLHLIDPPD